MRPALSSRNLNHCRTWLLGTSTRQLETKTWCRFLSSHYFWKFLRSRRGQSSQVKSRPRLIHFTRRVNRTPSFFQYMYLLYFHCPPIIFFSDILSFASSLFRLWSTHVLRESNEQRRDTTPHTLHTYTQTHMLGTPKELEQAGKRERASRRASEQASKQASKHTFSSFCSRSRTPKQCTPK